ncbi:MAG: sulfotransferase family protein [Limimaricola sp.]|uniref:sulfotransferase n=1 Tax=Limimaricola sp. TaxID=2211665 RepID=UPI001DE1D49F|nr:sulfotransferase [Limimaricola sp.]MBI1418500.1 sulfotransferase family protein [Limimaricola sp.]
MADPALLYCVGATKAGTTWLFAALRAHPQAHVPAVKEAHYWDTFAPNAQAGQIRNLRRRQAELARDAARAAVNGNAARAANLDRQVQAMEGLIGVLGTDRTAESDAAYWRWLSNGAGEARVVADMTPSYALVEEGLFARMLALRPVAKVIYLVRDPLARLWSHIRMMVKRAPGETESFDEAANNRLRAFGRGAGHADLASRGDYVAAIEKLRRAVPEGALKIAFTERMYDPEGWGGICDFLGIAHTAPNAARVHEGIAARMDDELAALAVTRLRPQYEWVAANVGTLPTQWQDSLARTRA